MEPVSLPPVRSVNFPPILESIAELDEEVACIEHHAAQEAEETQSSNSTRTSISGGSEGSSTGVVRIPGKFVHLVGTNPTLLTVQILLNDLLIPAVIDTGSSISLINNRLVEQHSLTIVEGEGDFDVLGEACVNSIGTLIGSVTIGNIPMGDTTFNVFREEINPNIMLILGVDFLKSNDLEVCVKLRKLIKYCSDEGKVELCLASSGKVETTTLTNLVCYANTSVQLKQGTTTAISVYLKDDFVSRDDMVLFTNHSVHPNLQGRVNGIAGLFDVESKRVLMVTSESDTNVKKGTPVGSLSSVVQRPQSDDETIVDECCTAEDLRSKVTFSNLTNNESGLVYAKFEECLGVFSMGDFDIGHASVTSHKIRLTDDTPIYQRPRRFPAPIADEIERQCNELNILDIIEPSISPWSAPVVPVRKKDGTIRLCIDYRLLNRVTIPDKFPMPNLTDSLFGLNGTKFFTSLDLVRGYYQVPIDEQSREYTAFSTTRNHWQFKRLSFGLRNAPSAFQREIQAVLGSFSSNKVIAHIVDILVMSSTFEEHLSLVFKVLKTLENYNIKIKLSKCDWFASQVRFLGHIVSSHGIKKTPEYMQKVVDYPQPKAVGELREFLGLVNFQ
jgi:hypothetical protein